MSRIRLIAIDLDNTLLASDSKLSEANKFALEKANEQGIEIVINTGRGLNGIYDDVRSVKGLRYGITSNGACVYNVQTEELLLKYCLSMESAQKLRELGHEFGITYEIFVGGRGYVSREYYENPVSFGQPERLEKYIKNTRIPVDDIDEFISEHIDEIENFALVAPNKAMHDELEKKVPLVCDDVFVTAPEVQWVEVMDRQCGKGKGMLHLCEHLNILPEETVAIGDSDNDMEMFEYAGISVCMENGSLNCREAADIVTKTNLEDGVAYAILNLLGLQF